MLRVKTALIVAEPWISKILSGQKTWEMRSTSTTKRGPIGLIAKGSGQVVGVVELVDVAGPLTRKQMLNSADKHQIPDEMVRSGEVEVGCLRVHLRTPTVPRTSTAIRLPMGHPS